MGTTHSSPNLTAEPYFFGVVVPRSDWASIVLMPPALVFFRAVARFGSSVKKSLSPRLNGQIGSSPQFGGTFGLNFQWNLNSGMQDGAPFLDLAGLPRRAGRGLVTLYRYTLSPLIGPRCRHLPSCSEYADEAIGRFGLWAGGWMALARILRCHPWGTAGLDFRANNPARALALVLALALRALARPQ